MLISQNNVTNQRNSEGQEQQESQNQLEIMNYLVNQKRSVLYQHQQQVNRKDSINIPLESIVHSSIQQLGRYYIIESKFLSQELNANQMTQEHEQNQFSLAHVNGDKLIEELIIKAHNQVKSWETSNEDMQRNYTQVQISQNALRSNIIKNAKKDSSIIIFELIAFIQQLMSHKVELAEVIFKPINMNI